MTEWRAIMPTLRLRLLDHRIHRPRSPRHRHTPSRTPRSTATRTVARPATATEVMTVILRPPLPPALGRPLHTRPLLPVGESTKDSLVGPALPGAAEGTP